MKLAIITHSQAFYDLVSQCFEADGATCLRFGHDNHTARALTRENPTAVVLDAASGIDALHPVLARRACYGERRTPLIVIGDFGDRASIVHALESGADDIVLAPVDRRELYLRLHMAVQRFETLPNMRESDEHTIEFGRYILDRRQGTVRVDDECVRLTAREFAIAWLLFTHRNKYVSRRDIAGAVWGSSEDIVGRTLEQHIYKLRKKLWLDGGRGTALRTMYAHGYRVEPCEHPASMETPATAASRPSAGETVASANLSKHHARRRHIDDGPPALTVHSSDSETARNAVPWPFGMPVWRLDVDFHSTHMASTVRWNHLALPPTCRKQ